MTAIPISRQIEQALKKEIIEGKLEFGRKLTIADLKEKWGVSSTPIRDAIKSLEAKGFIEIAPRESIIVSRMDPQTFRDVFDVRMALESAAVELATPLIPTEKIDETIQQYREAGKILQETKDAAFLIPIDYLVHQLFYDYCGNKRLVRIAQEFNDLAEWARSVVTDQPRALEFALPEHIHVLNAVRRRSVVDAQAAMRIHLGNVYRRTVEAL
jgi:DNA-binding GntR family transcriptional regulator